MWQIKNLSYSDKDQAHAVTVTLPKVQEVLSQSWTPNADKKSIQGSDESHCKFLNRLNIM